MYSFPVTRVSDSDHVLTVQEVRDSICNHVHFGCLHIVLASQAKLLSQEASNGQRLGDHLAIVFEQRQLAKWSGWK